MKQPGGLAPMLWLDAMPYGRMFRSFAAEGPRSPSLAAHMISIGEVTSSDGLIHHDLQRAAVVELSRLDRAGVAPAGPELVTDAIVSSDVAMFHMYGRQVFHLDDALVEELVRTDVDDVPCSEIRLPHHAFYLTFGDAAREAGLGDVQGILVTSEEAHPGYLEMTAMRVEDGRAVAVDMAYLDLDVGGTLAEALVDAHEDVARSDPTAGAPIDAHGRGDIIREGFRRHSLAQLAGMRRLNDAIRLLANALLYIDATNAGRRRGWHPATPPGLASRADGATGAAKAEQALVRQGWTRVTVMTLEDGATRQDGSGEAGARRAHWRRGHWRRQRHGAGNALVRMVRIRPVRVAGRGPGEVEGRVYDVV